MYTPSHLKLLHQSLLLPFNNNEMCVMSDILFTPCRSVLMFERTDKRVEPFFLCSNKIMEYLTLSFSVVIGLWLCGGNSSLGF